MENNGLNVKVFFDTIVTTANKIKTLDEKVALSEDAQNELAYNEFQTVLTLGKQARDMGLRIGDEICLKVQNFARRKTKEDSVKNAMQEYYEVTLPLEAIGENEVMFISSRDVKYKILNETV